MFSHTVAAISRRVFVASLMLAGLLFSQAAFAATCKYFVEISVDGLGSVYLQPMIEKGELPNFRRFQTEGAWTNNARNDDDVTVTLPNHTTMMTGRSVMGPGGHHWTKNTDPSRGETLHNQKRHDGTYIASVFDVAHDHGLRTVLMSGKTKFSLYRDSYDAAHGAACTGKPDYGRNKLDCFLYEKSCEIMTAKFVAAMKTKPFQYAFLHYADPDAVGHAHGWGSDAYQQAIRKVDAQLGRLFQLIETSDQLRGKTTVFLSADHGGKDHNHANNLLPEVYTIPVYVWGCGAAVGQDLYKLNAATRRDPGNGHPLHTDPVQPIRNGDGANLALKLFGLGPIPGSTINREQDLAIGPYLVVTTHPILKAESSGARADANAADQLTATLHKQCKETGRTPGEYTVQGLDLIDRFFETHPADETNAAMRLKAFNLVDALTEATGRLGEWPFYITAVQGSAYAQQRAALLEAGGVEYFMVKRLRGAFAKIKQRKVAPGQVAITRIYNMGVVIETSSAAIGIDLAGPHVEELAPSLDALVLSHEHGDHFNSLLCRAMGNLKKPVYTYARCTQFPHIPSLVRMAEDQRVCVGEMELIAHIGSHYPESFVKHVPRMKLGRHNMLDITILTDRRKGKPSLSIYHVGDDFDKDSVLHGFKGNGHPDVFLGRGTPDPACWKDRNAKGAKAAWELNDSIGDPAGQLVALKPRLFLPGHVAEMGHGLNMGGMMPFRDAFGVASLIPAANSAVLIWGERLVLDAGRSKERPLLGRCASGTTVSVQ